jgi:hypothetical protein
VEKHRAELGAETRTVLVDGELLSWHGARLALGLSYLRSLAEGLPG